MTPAQLRTALRKLLPRGASVIIHTHDKPHPRHHVAIIYSLHDGRGVRCMIAKKDTCAEAYRSIACDYANAIMPALTDGES